MSETLDIKENVCLAPFTTLQIGGKARFFVEVHDESEVAEALFFAADRKLPVFVLGGGSNVLISDRGFDGLVIRIAICGVTQTDSAAGVVFLSVGAGESWDEFVAFCLKQGLAGVECLSGIPGSVGGTPVQNVGAYGQEVAETIVSVRCVDRRSSEITTFPNRDCGFSYRKSIFNSTERDRFIVLSVTFGLALDGAARITYKELRDRFGGSRPGLSDVRDAVLQIRRAKSMVTDANDPNSLSAGSFFKNPIVSIEEYHRLKDRFGGVPQFPYERDHVKVPAAWLIENAGIQKGFILNGAGISENHTLAIINRGSATAADVLELKTHIQKVVKEKFGIHLDPEPIFVGVP